VVVGGLEFNFNMESGVPVVLKVFCNSENPDKIAFQFCRRKVIILGSTTLNWLLSEVLLTIFRDEFLQNNNKSAVLF
jgi:hypothetical protein